MNEPHYGHAGTVYGGYMYISGKWYISNKEARVMLCGEFTNRFPIGSPPEHFTADYIL